MFKNYLKVGLRHLWKHKVFSVINIAGLSAGLAVLVSILISTPLAWYFMNEWLRDFAYRIHIHWWVFLAGGIIAISIALLTVSIQSIKAAIVNPVKSLRTE